jgi:hypothetical protein
LTRLGQFLEQASLNMTQHFNGVRSLTTITAFQAIANHMAAIEGRKNGGLALARREHAAASARARFKAHADNGTTEEGSQRCPAMKRTLSVEDAPSVHDTEWPPRQRSVNFTSQSYLYKLADMHILGVDHVVALTMSAGMYGLPGPNGGGKGA